MAPKRLFWHLYPPYLVIILLTVGVAVWMTSRTTRDVLLRQIKANMEAKAALFSAQAAPEGTLRSPAAVHRLAVELGRTVNARFTVILPSGRVIADTDKDPATMDNHSDRPEIVRALAGDKGISRRYSDSLRQHMMYVAVPLTDSPNVNPVVRVAIPGTEIEERLAALQARFAWTAAILVVLAAVVGAWLSRRVVRPLEELTTTVRNMEAGSPDFHLHRPHCREMAGLADSISRMAASLHGRIERTARQQNEQQAILSSMAEGVIAVDKDQNVLQMNAAAASIFGVDAGRSKGRNIREVIRNVEFADFASRATTAGNPIQRDIAIGALGNTVVEAKGAGLTSRAGERIGAVLVIHDVTNLRRLENVRQEFVANVSHELRTPMTAIKGFVETLQDGAAEDPELLQRFLSIISHRMDNLMAIITDLLALSRLESDGADKQRVEKTRSRLLDVFNRAVETTRAAAAARQIDVTPSCPEDLEIHVNPSLLERALVNLLANAIEYSPQGARVRLTAEKTGEAVLIRVQDTGIGIAAHQLPRIFERFYRVDKSRSRESGGTGLGLSIVKHVVLAHGGTVSVDSRLGRGSTFTVHLPAD